MKILCVSDYVDPLIYNQNVKEAFPDIDLILCAGDLPMDYIDFIVSVFNKPTYFVFGNHDLKEYHLYHKDSRLDGSRFTKNYDQAIHGHGATYLGFKNFVNENLIFEDPQTGKKTPLLIAGTSGTVRYNNGLCQFSDSHMKFKLLKMVPRLIINKLKYGRFLDIFMTHASPRHIHDHDDQCHIGLTVITGFYSVSSPLIWFMVIYIFMIYVKSE